MSKINIQGSFLNQDDASKVAGPVTCLGMTFANDQERRTYFTEELRKKLPELKKIEGFPLGEDEDILALSDPPYYTACPNPFITAFIEQWEKEKLDMYGPETEDYHSEPFAADVSEGKNDPIYNAHSYHTKVPHKAIMRYILHYTKPGDIIFDGFCGTGMTGVAAQMCGDSNEVLKIGQSEESKCTSFGERKIILSDLSPIATYISSNYNKHMDTSDLGKDAIKIIMKCEEEFGWMYETEHDESELFISSAKGKINYVVWSDVFICPNCSNELVFFDVAMNDSHDAVEDNFSCNHCKAVLTKKDCDRAREIYLDHVLKTTQKRNKQVPALINYSIGNKRFEKKTSKSDLLVLTKIDSHIEQINIFTYPMMNKGGENWGEIWRAGYHFGVTHSHHFYTTRNLLILTELWYRSEHNSLLRWAITSVLNYVNKKQSYTGGGGGMPGVLYIASLVQEKNIFLVLNRKINSLIKAFKHEFRKSESYAITTQSSCEIETIPNNSFDYIFIDPPFGGNIMYSEGSFLWESWLKVFTNNKNEAVESKYQEKKIDDYQRLMHRSFSTCYRILKPGRWITVEFSNSQAKVWNAIQEAIQRAGFVIANVAALDKGQGGFKSVTSTIAVKQDLVISAYKPSDEMKLVFIKNQNSEDSAWVFLRKHLEQLPVFVSKKGSVDYIVERTPRVLFDRMISYHVQNGYSVPISSGDFQAGIAQRFPMRDGMVFLEIQVAEYDKKRLLAHDFMQMSLFVSDENSAIEWLRQQLMKKPQTRQDLHPGYMKEIQHIAKYEILPELDVLLEQSFLQYEGTGPVPSQIHAYLSSNYKDLRELDKEDVSLRRKAKDRWYVPDPNKQADLEKLREKSLMREFGIYVDGIKASKKKLKQFRLEAIRAGFKKAWSEKDYQTIVEIGSKIPDAVLQEDDKLLMYFDNAQTRLE